MATKATLTMKGLESYLEALASAGANVDAAVGSGLKDGAELIKAEMQDLVPVGQAPEDPHPGNLKANITIDGPHLDGNYSWVEVGLVPGKVDKDTAIYGNVQEYGNASNQAQSYIRTGVDNTRARAKRALLERLKQAGMV